MGAKDDLIDCRGEELFEGRVQEMMELRTRGAGVMETKVLDDYTDIREAMKPPGIYGSILFGLPLSRYTPDTPAYGKPLPIKLDDAKLGGRPGILGGFIGGYIGGSF